MSNSDWVAQILAMTTDELAERNGAGLLAQQLQTTLRDKLADSRTHADEVRAYVKANAGGLAVYWLAREAQRQGRKTMRADDIIGAMDRAQTLDPNLSVAADNGADS